MRVSVGPNGLKDRVSQPGRRGVRALSDLLAGPQPQVAPNHDDLLGRAAFRLGGRDLGHGPENMPRPRPGTAEAGGRPAPRVRGNLGAGEVSGAKRDKRPEILRPEFAVRR